MPLHRPINLHFADECYRSYRRNFKHYKPVVSDTLTAATVRECKNRCRRAQDCGSFSYSDRRSRDNCLISQIEAGDIKAYSDLVADSDWVVYEFDLRNRRCADDADDGDNGDDEDDRGGSTVEFCDTC